MTLKELYCLQSFEWEHPMNAIVTIIFRALEKTYLHFFYGYDYSLSLNYIRNNKVEEVQ